LTSALAEWSSEVQARLLQAGQPVNTLDVMIAGIALANGIDKVATRDSHFLKIAAVSELEVISY